MSVKILVRYDLPSSTDTLQYDNYSYQIVFEGIFEFRDFNVTIFVVVGRTRPWCPRKPVASLCRQLQGGLHRAVEVLAVSFGSDSATLLQSFFGSVETDREPRRRRARVQRKRRRRRSSRRRSRCRRPPSSRNSPSERILLPGARRRLEFGRVGRKSRRRIVKVCDVVTFLSSCPLKDPVPLKEHKDVFFC